jgi:hypothetical protein
MDKRSMMYQKMIDFDAPRPVEKEHVAEKTSEPPPADQARRAPPLVRPDRQIVYAEENPYRWPDPATLHDHDTITVDRLTDDIDGQCHRFVIKRGDTVEVFFHAEKVELGKVVGVSHQNHEVRVRFSEGTEGLWFYKGMVYPAVEPQPERRGTRTPLSRVVAGVNERHAGDLEEADRIEEGPVAALAPYTFDDFRKFHAEFSRGPVAFAEYRAEFERVWDSQGDLKAELIARFKAQELAALASRMNLFARGGKTKEQNAQSIVSSMLGYFVLGGGVSYSPFSGETYETALKKKVASLTEGEYYRHFEKKQEESLAKEAALADPQNLADFRLVIDTKGEDWLTDEQLARYDAMRADMQRSLREEHRKASTVQKFESESLDTVAFQIKEGFHDKRQCPLWIVQLSSRVEREAFGELSRKAKMLGGWFSSFKKSDSGFQFLDKSQADRFCELLSGDVDRSDVLEGRKERRELSAAETLHELAKNLMERAEETIERSSVSLQNTARRADMQAGVRGRAYADQALSRTIHSLAEALSRGEAKYLDGIRHKTQLQTLESVLYHAKCARVRALRNQPNERQGRVEEEPMSLATLRFAEFPYPHLYRKNLEEALQQGLRTSGVKKSAETLRKRLASKTGEYIEFSREYDLGALFDFVDRCKAQRIDVERIWAACENYKRLVRAGITSLPELRAALREYLEHRAERRGDDPVKVAERELIGRDLPGFFPTPRPVIERMLELAEVETHHRVLEPSCGKGDILDALKEECDGIELIAIERNRTLEDVLSAKGHEVTFADFLEHAGSYDRVVMNPPFEELQDITHVKHAYSLLTPGGRLVSVMSEGPFYRSDNKSIAFRAWLDEVGAQSEQLPDDAFAGPGAFCQTGVRTRLITIEKE